MVKYLRQSFKGKSKWLLTSTAVSFTILLLILPVTSAGDGSSKSGKTAKGTAKTAEKKQGNVLHFTDIHFNPFYIEDPEELKDKKAKYWEKIFKSSKFKKLVTDKGKRPKEYANETTYNLLVSSLKEMENVSPNPDFIIFTGDFLVHNFDTKYKNNFCTKVGLEKFIKKTVTFVVIMLDKYFRNVPVYVSLGNNDSYKGNYIIEPKGKFLDDTMPIISEKWLNTDANRESFAKTYAVGGYFTVVPPKSESTRIISLNSIFFHSRHEEKYKECKWAFDQLDWLRKQLEAAKEKDEKVWLLMHSPPGADYFKALNGKFEPYWQYYYTAVFTRLIADYSSILEAAYAGHTHMDEFQLVFDCTSRCSDAIAFVKICPSDSNVRNTNNPAFLNLIYNRTDFSLRDYGVYYLDLGKSNKKWKLEYMFNEAYEQTAVNAAALRAVYDKIKKKETWRTKYMNYFYVKLPQTVIPLNWNAYWCGIGNLRQEEFETCNKASN